jgi:hypothetical protein
MHTLRHALFSAIKDGFGMRRADALAESWREIRNHGNVIEDLVHLGHLFEPGLNDPETGKPFSHDELIARAARKDLALQLLARAEITPDELNFIRNQGAASYETISYSDDDTDSDAGDQLDAQR